MIPRGKPGNSSSIYTPPFSFSWARRLGLSEHDAADLLQDIFTVLVEKLPAFRYNPQQSFCAWMRTILLNRWRNRCRQMSCQRLDGTDDLDQAIEPEIPLFEEEEYRQALVSRALALMQAEFQPVTWRACWEFVVRDRPATVAACWSVNGTLRVARINTAKGRITSITTTIPRQSERSGRVAFSADGRWMAATTDSAYQVVLYDLQQRKEVRRLGPFAAVPRVVGWTAKGHGVVWGYQPRPKQDWHKALSRGLSLDTLELLPRKIVQEGGKWEWSKELNTAVSGGLPRGWRLVRENETRTYLVRKGKKIQIALWDVRDTPALAFTSEAGKDPLLVVNHRGQRIAIVNLDTGKQVGRIRGQFNPVYDMALSPELDFSAIRVGGLSRNTAAKESG